MTRALPPSPSSGVGRADLLRVLAVSDRERLALEDDGQIWFGYQRRDEGPAVHGTEISIQGHAKIQVQVEATPAATGRRLPLRMPQLPYVVSRETRPAVAPVDPRQSPAEPLSAEDCRPPSVRRLIQYEDLVPTARLLPALRHWLGAVRTGPLDLERLSRQLAAADPPRRLPRRIYRRWHPDLVVVVDFCDRLWPYREDMHRLAERLLRQCGRSGVSLRIVNRGPAGGWTDWRDEQSAVIPPVPRPWTPLPPGTPVLLVTDLGILQGADSGLARQWTAFVAELLRGGVRPLALAALGRSQLDEAVGPRLPVLRWSPDSRLHPERGQGAGEVEPAGLAELLALAAPLRRVDPPLLRALRRVLPEESLNAGLEGAFWCHPDVAAGTAAALRPDRRDRHLQRFRQNLPSGQRELAQLRRDHHAHLSAALHWEELLSYGAHAHPEALDSETTAEIGQAEQRLQKLAPTLAQAGAGRLGGSWQEVARAIETRADAGMVNRYSHLLMPLVVERVRREQQAGIKPEVPDWVDPAELSAGLDEDRIPVEAWLVRDAERGAILLQARSPGTRQSSMGPSLWLDAGGFRLIEQGGSGRWLAPASLPVELTKLQAATELSLETARETLRIAPVRRPFGTTGWSCGPGGVSVEATRQGKTALVVWEDAELQVRQRPQPASGDVPAWTLAGSGTRMNSDASGLGGTIRWGLDEFGVYGDFTLVTEHGTATQRFRYVEPGTFLMGSPEEETRGLARKEQEKSWFEDEHPRHPVTLTRGYWLADTPCTQAMWQAVTGVNPSQFQSPDRPVERVSWDDVQEFLSQLKSWAPGLPADLPTEAEWEYACRAGTDTALYSGPMEILGANNAPALDPIAWYGGNSGVGFELDTGSDSSDWPERQYPDSPSGTHPVGRKQPNPWGLYDMLGNVWEWCGDGFRDYAAEPVEDPVGPVTEERPLRAVRGGSWGSFAGWVRSAYRSRLGPGDSVNYPVFRLSLRSIEPGQAWAGGTPESVPGGRPVRSSPLEEEKTAAAERPPRWYERFLPGRKRKD